MTTRDDIIYLTLLIVSIPIGLLTKNIQSSFGRQLLTLVIGLVMVVVTTGVDVLHPLITTLGTFVICRLSYRYCHIISFVFVFSYLLFFRICYLFGIPAPCGPANAVQLILTIKMAGISFDIYFLRLRQIEHNREDTKLPGLPIKSMPTLFDFLSYSFCYCGLLTGPFYQYRVYRDMIDNRNASEISVFKPVLKRLLPLPILVVLVTVFFPYQPSYIISEEFYKCTFVERFLYLLIHFMVFRGRFYIGWLLAECSCIMATLGAYPEQCRPRPGLGPTLPIEEKVTEETQYNFETIYNIDIYKIETGTTLRPCMRYWNMSVQWWLSAYVYRYMLRNYHNLIRLLGLFTISAFWHGIHLGYYISFGTVLILTIAQDRFISTFSRYFQGSIASKVFHVIACVITIRCYEYASLGFILLDFSETMKVKQSIYYWGYIYAAVIIAVSLIVPKSNIEKKNQ